jgi:phospholipase/carboxylesterase
MPAALRSRIRQNQDETWAGLRPRLPDLKVMLPQFALPGEERMPLRDLPFVHRLYLPDDPDGSVIVHLHESGGSEATLCPSGRTDDLLVHSNGANFLDAVMLLHPGVFRRAILLRAGAVLEDVPPADLTRTEVLLVSGATDPFATTAADLGTFVRERGARPDMRSLPAGHDLTQGDLGALNAAGTGRRDGFTARRRTPA